MAIDLDFLERAYFSMDEPVPYKIKDKYIKIKPVLVKDSEIFMDSVDILMIDKNDTPNPEIISMSYLQFIVDVLFNADEKYIVKLANILSLCLDSEEIQLDRIDGKYCLVDRKRDIVIKPKQFEEIRRIILYQNIRDFDDEYVSPDFKKMMQEMKELQSKDVVFPSIREKIAMITAHCGLSKAEQKEMTMRSHADVFAEMVAQVDYVASKGIATYGGVEIEHFAFKKKTGKYDGYVTTEQEYAGSMGSDYNAIQQSLGSDYSNTMLNIANNFNN